MEKYLMMCIGAVRLALLTVWAAGLIGTVAAHAAETIAGPSLLAMRAVGDVSRTRFIVDMSYAVSADITIDDRPYRMIITIPGASLSLPKRNVSPDQGLVRDVSAKEELREGSGRVAMITVALAAPAVIENAALQPAAHGQPARLVIDLSRVDEAMFANLQKLELLKAQPALSGNQRSGAPSSGDAPPPSPPSAEAPLAAGVSDADLEALFATAVRNRRGRDITIVIDPGHGGYDPGAVSGDILEKDITLRFARVLRDHLQSYRRFRIVLTRDDDSFVPLRQRVARARALGASLFLSIHADALRDHSVRGGTIYTLSAKASDAEAAEIAHRENRVDRLFGAETADVADILTDLTQRETHNLSLLAAREILRRLKPVMRLHRRPLRSAGFRVLTAPDVPSVLIELGYLSNRADTEILQSPALRQQTARALAQAVADYLTARSPAGQNSR